MANGLIYNALYDSSTHTVSFVDKAGNTIYSFVVDLTPPQIVDDPTKPLYLRSLANGSTVFIDGAASSVDDSTFESSTDGTTWTDLHLGSANAITLNWGEGVYIRAKVARTVFPTSGVPCYIGMTGNIEAYHNVHSVLSPNFASISDLTTVGSYCLSALFSPGTTSDTSTARNAALTKAPLLPATTLSNYCYSGMFLFCTALHTPPQIPATTLAANCCNNMFNQSGLMVAPALPATTAASYCYNRMFKGCALTEPPSLPATTLSSYCYRYMFENCTALTKTPLLPATTLSNNCYQAMFKGCSSLNEVRIAATKISASNALSNWLDGVAATGDFYCVEGVPFTVDSSSGIPLGWTVHRTAVDSPNLPLYLKSTQNGSTVALNKLSTHSSSDIYQKSTDNVNWTTFDSAVTLNDGEGIFVRISANRATTFSNNLHVQFAMSGAIQAYNNINSLVSPTFNNLSDLTTVVGSGVYCHCRLFDSCTALTKAPLLPSTTLSEGCYRATFTGCTGLTQPPELPATAMAESCYRAMFEGCTGLTQAPALPAMTLAPYCYYYMLKGCTFTAAPVLPATTLANYCYGGLFNNCTSLVTAPAMAATTLAPQCCQQMFWGCTSLTRGPDLLALTLTTDCYDRIFQDCSSLNEVHLYATASVTASNLYNWLSNVSASGTVYCDPSITLTADSPSGLPTGWTRAALS